MPLRPTDIQRPGIAAPGSARVTQSTIKSPRSIDNRGSALGDVADATRRLGAATENLAQGRRRGGDALARAVEQQSGVVGRTGEQRASIIERAAQQRSVVSENFAKNLGDITDIFLKLHDQREDAAGKLWENRYNLNLTRRMATAEEENKNAPGTGEDYINKANETYEKAKTDAYEDTKGEIGYDASDATRSNLETTGYAMQAGALKRTVVTANNQKVNEMVAFADQTVEEYINSVQATGDEEAGILMGNAAIDALVDVLPAEQVAAKRRGLAVSAARASINYSLDKNDFEAADTKYKALVGVSGINGSHVTATVTQAAGVNGVDPMTLLVLGSIESGMDPKKKNSKSSAAGIFQFISDTGTKYGLPKDASTASVEEQARAGAEFTAANIAILTRFLGRDPSIPEVYMAHFLGASKAVRILEASDGDDLEKIIGKKAIKANNMKGWTVGMFNAWASNKVQDHMNAIRTGKVFKGGKFTAANASASIEAVNKIGSEIEVAKGKYVNVQIEQATVNMSSMPSDQIELYANSFRPENISPEYETPEGLIEAGSIDVDERPRIENPDGSVSTVISKSFNIDGKEVLIPTIDHEGKVMSDDEAIKLYKKTGEHLGKFESAEDADRYAIALSEHQAGPKADKHQMKLYDKVNEQAVTVQKLRMEDPALSVESVPSVIEARQVALKSKKPEDIQAAAAVSLLAQEAAGIPEHSRSPVTRLEAKALAMPIIAAGRITGRNNVSKRNEFGGLSEYDALEMVFNNVFLQYGEELGAQVMPHVIEETTKDRQLGRTAAILFRKLLAGNATGSDLKQGEALAETSDAKKAAGDGNTVPASKIDLRQFGGAGVPAGAPIEKPPLPGPKAIQLLHDNPGSASNFNSIFGPGAANRYLKGGN